MNMVVIRLNGAGEMREVRLTSHIHPVYSNFVVDGTDS